MQHLAKLWPKGADPSAPPSTVGANFVKKADFFAPDNLTPFRGYPEFVQNPPVFQGADTLNP